MRLGKLILAAMILGPVGYCLGGLLGYLWTSSHIFLGALSAGLFTLAGYLSDAGSMDATTHRNDDDWKADTESVFIERPLGGQWEEGYFDLSRREWVVTCTEHQ